jgi:hypothetical protein
VQAIRVLIPDDVAAKLTELARQEYRAPKQQAAVLLVEAVTKAELAPVKDRALAAMRARRS